MRLLPYLRLAAGPWIVFFRYVLYFVQFIPYPHIFFTAISRLQAQDYCKLAKGESGKDWCSSQLKPERKGAALPDFAFDRQRSLMPLYDFFAKV